MPHAAQQSVLQSPHELIAYKGYIIEAKREHTTGIHENWWCRIHNGKFVIANFGKPVPAMLIGARRMAIGLAKQYIDSMESPAERNRHA